MESNSTMWEVDMQTLEQRSLLGEMVGMKDQIQCSIYVERIRSEHGSLAMPMGYIV